MNPPFDRELIELAVFMGLLSPETRALLLREITSGEDSSRYRPLARKLVEREILTGAQIRQLLNLLGQGFLYCPPCRDVYGQVHLENCPKCSKKLHRKAPLLSDDDVPTLVDTLLEPSGHSRPRPPSSEEITPEAGEGETLAENYSPGNFDDPTLAEDPLSSGTPLRGEETRADERDGQSPTPHQNPDGATFDDQERRGGTGPPGKEGPLFLPRPPGEFAIKGKLGQGGYGAVYQVKDPMTGRNMAFKVIPGEKVRERVKERFLREIQFTSQLQHPHIMPLYRSGYLDDDQNTPYYIMKEIRGGSLRDLLDGISHEKWKEELAHLLEIFLKILEAMAYAHEQGIIHRDLKPDNIAVGDFGEVLVMDWGIACYRGEKVEGQKEGEEPDFDDEGNLTQAGSIMGTPGYLSPEQAQGGKIDERSDIFSLGAILYEILTGEIPFDGPPQKRLVQTLMNDPVDPELAAPQRKIPPELAAIAQKALSRPKYLRYQTVSELREDLLRYRQGFSVTALRDSSWRRVWKWTKRNRGLALTGVAVILALGLAFPLGQWWLEARSWSQAQRYVQEAQDVLEAVSQVPSKKKEERSLILEDNPAQTNQRRKEIVQLFEARRKLDQARQLAPHSGRITRALFEVEEKIGRLALEGRNYLLSQASFERCRRLGFEEEAKKLLAELEARKNELRRRRVQTLKNIMEEIGRTPPKEGRFAEYVTQILRLKSPEITQALMKYVNSEKDWPRKLAIETLGKLKDNETKWKGKRAGWYLMERLKNLHVERNSQEAEALIWALGRLREERANELVRKVRDVMGENSTFSDRTLIPFRWLPVNESAAQSARDWINRGRLFYKKSLDSQALQCLERALKLDPDNAEIYFYRANVYSRQGQLEKAIDGYNRALELRPKLWEAYLNRGSVYLGQGKFQKAIDDLNRYLQVRKDDGIALINRGEAYYNLGQYGQALKDFNHLIEIDPRKAEAYSRRARVYDKLGKYEKALRDYGQAITLDPHLAQYYYRRGRIYFKMQKWEKAWADFNKAIEVDPQAATAYVNRGALFYELGYGDRALADFKQALELDPKSIGVYFNRGLLHKKAGRWKEAKEDFAQVLELDPHHKSAYFYLGEMWEKLGKDQKALRLYNKGLEIHSRSARGYFRRGMWYFKKKKMGQALQDLSQAAKFSPREMAIFELRAKIYKLQGRRAKAIEEYSYIIDNGYKKPAIYYQRGLTYLEMKKYSQALDDANQAIGRDSKRANAYYLRGLVLKAQKKYQAGIKDFTRTLQLSSRFALPFYHRAQCYSELDKLDRALADINRGISSGQYLGTAYSNRSYIHYQQGKYSRALKDAQRALQHNSNLPTAYFNRARAREKLGKHHEALRDFGQILKMDPRFAKAYRDRGKLYLKLGEEEKARADFRRYLKLDPDAPEKEEIKGYLGD